MAKASVTVKCSECGCEYRIEKKCYNRREADEFEAWVESQDHHLCHRCYAEMAEAKRQAKREEENRAAAEASADLPALEGSEKQIAWATTIRANALRACKADLRVAIARQRRTAAWWIDNRNDLANTSYVAARMISEDLGISVSDAMHDVDTAKSWLRKIMAA